MVLVRTSLKSFELCNTVGIFHRRNEKVNSSSVLDLKVRKKIYALVEKFAGCHFRELERKSSLQTGVLQYHLAYLVKKGLLKERKENNYVRYFPIHLNVSNQRLIVIRLLRSRNGLPGVDRACDQRVCR